ncbi:hypothetical protein KP509_06G089300 [Ceratopteris richardii]|uniref:WD repeat-containing protein 44 n=1 Tax=Ceratopteris richardii TaxID=49495 RepID=A0A8T2UQI3_CERRI|nr:hypothetical protein KP509_06G089300 [Ceratopteris richardii]
MDSYFEEEEEDQFFETVEDLASSSDADSGTEERYLENSSRTDGNASSVPNFPFSKYDVWKSRPGSVLERRQRLFTQMGLRIEQDDFEDVVILLDSPPTAGSLPATSVCTSRDDTNGKNPSCSLDESSVRMIPSSPGPSQGRSIVRSRSDGTFSRLENAENVDHSSLRLVRSGAATPLVNHGGPERLGNSARTVWKTGFGSNPLSSKPPLDGKRRNLKLNLSGGGSGTRKLQFQWSKFGRFRVTDKNGNSLFDSEANLSREVRGPALFQCDGVETVSSNNGEVFCRIKDLDSGKEFVVNEVRKDGMWNKIREVATGREVTLEEFESTLGLSPIVQEVMRRERAADATFEGSPMDSEADTYRKKKGWFKALTGAVRGSWQKGGTPHYGSGSDREASTERSSRKSGSATDDSQDASLASRPVKVRVHKKSAKELGGLNLRQEIQAHQGAIWTMKFSQDGQYLATAGQDRIVKVWEVYAHSSRLKGSPTSSGEFSFGLDSLHENSTSQRHDDLKRSDSRSPGHRDVIPKASSVFLLSEKPKCVFEGHLEDILDLSWSPSQHSLLSSSMDKTVRLWDVSSRACLKIFTHNDYVTCIQFHPLKPGYFISGSLDGKVRIWSIPEPQVIDWVDVQEMVTAACYTPDGQGAVVGSYKGTCRLYETPGNKLQLKTTFEVCSPNSKRSQAKKITGFQFVPGDGTKILITSNDSRIRIYDGSAIRSKFKGFRNSKSHISASFSRSGKYIICASEDSRVCVWNYNDCSYEHSNTRKKLPTGYEDFSSKHVLVAIPWPGFSRQPIQKSAQMGPKDSNGVESLTAHTVNYIYPGAAGFCKTGFDHLSNCESERCTDVVNSSRAKLSIPDYYYTDSPNARCPTSRLDIGPKSLKPEFFRDSCCGSSLISNCVSVHHVGNNGFFSDCKGSATWPEEKLPRLQQESVTHGAVSMGTAKDLIMGEHDNRVTSGSAWGLVIVTGGSRGEIRIFQNHSLPVRF